MKYFMLLIISIFCETNCLLRCKEKCGNFVSLKNNPTEIDMSAANISIKYDSYDERLEVYILRRKVYSVQRSAAFADRAPLFYRDMNMLPDIIEAGEWVLKKQCKIGHVCVLNGDCYGGGSDFCRESSAHKWVDSRDFQFHGADWKSSWWSSCTQDWFCEITKKDLRIYINEKGVPYIKPNEKTYHYQEGGFPKIYTEGDIVIYIGKNSKSESGKTKSQCVKKDKSVFCHYKDKDENKMIAFQEGKKCLVNGGKYLCIDAKDFKAVSDDIEAKAATINDVNDLKNLVLAHIGLQNYNNMILKSDDSKIKNLLNLIVLSIARGNPLIIKDITGHSNNVKWNNGMLELCKCEDETEDQCNFNRHVKNSEIKCNKNKGKKNKEGKKVLDLLDFQDLDNYFPSDLKFKGKDSTVYEDDEERDNARNEMYEPKQSGKYDFFNWLPGSGVFSGIGSYLTYINTFFIVLFLIRGR